MAEEVDDDDLICYFCLWHAEFQLKFDELADESLVWWNLGLELDEAARELRKNYFEGKLEQCWVQLEKIELPQIIVLNFLCQFVLEARLVDPYALI
ncbi:Hypothetical predicted protein [Cloeon dipterum]|uniref:Uncharacterized protein n=1 Tax=Cloeon dipterum TaxID=197152 RepID=A0A8S1E2J7_9INSE|nr:Hypothetical predicted protein [Cloeon dipterum]